MRVSRYQTLTATVLGLSLPFTIMAHVSFALTGAEVNKVAEQVTVFIQGVGNSSNFGSGVIIKRSGTTYTVLSAAHVFEEGDRYTVTTPDNFQHTVQQIQRIPNVDLATFRFESSNPYPVAKQGNSDSVQPTSKVYVTGFPEPGFNISIPTYTITDGNITTVLHRGIRDGYGFAYTNPTRAGMSGGPVFNEQAEVIAIHGRKEGEVDGSLPTGAWLNLGVPIHYAQVSGGIVGGDLPRPLPEKPLTSLSVNPSEPQSEPVQEKSPELVVAKSNIAPPQIPIQLLTPFSNASPASSSLAATKDLETSKKCKDITVNGQITRKCQAVFNFSAFQQQLQEASRPEDSAQSAETWILEGNESLTKTNYAQAVQQFSSAIQLAPNDGVGYFNRGIAYYHLGKSIQAHDDFKTAATLFQPSNHQKELIRTKEILAFFE